MSLMQKFQNISKKKSFKYGLPFLLCIVSASFALTEFNSVRFQFRKKTLIRPDEMEKLGVPMKNPKDVTLESEYEKIKTLDIDNWENKRGPRPWEENVTN